MLTMRAAIFSPDGAERVEGAATFAIGSAAGPQRLAADLLARATPGIAGRFAGPQ
jgi:hydroxymethylbilane synthase